MQTSNESNNMKNLRNSLKKDAQKFQKKSKSSKELIFNYPTLFQKKNDLEQKTLKYDFRKQARTKLKRYVNNILSDFITESKESLAKEIDAFIKFYKETYLTNDFKVESIYKGKDQLMKSDVENVFRIVQNHLSTSKKKSAKPKKDEKAKASEKK